MKFEDILGNFRDRKFYTPYTSNKIYKLPINLKLYYYRHIQTFDKTLIYSNTWCLGSEDILRLYTNDCILLNERKRFFKNETQFSFSTYSYTDDDYYMNKLFEDNKEFLKQKRRERKINKLRI